jgi:hypothetical protein
MSALCTKTDGDLTCIAMAGHDDECVFDKTAAYRTEAAPRTITSLQVHLPNGGIAMVESPEFIRALSASPARPAPWSRS